MLIRLSDVNKIYNGNPILQNIDLTIEDRDRIGLIGVNGCGKSTLLKLITGQILPDHIKEGDGEIAYSGKTSVGYLEQMSGLDRESTVWDEMRGVFSELLSAQERMLLSISRCLSKNSTISSPVTLPTAREASWLSSLVLV